MNMVCANPECVAELKYLRGGRLFLMERQTVITREGARAAAPKRTSGTRRYFWLCEDCSKVYSIQRWTDVGIELGVKRPPARVRLMDAKNSRAWAVPGLVG